jgi:hypothetical protein
MSDRGIYAILLLVLINHSNPQTYEFLVRADEFNGKYLCKDHQQRSTIVVLDILLGLGDVIITAAINGDINGVYVVDAACGRLRKNCKPYCKSGR